MNRAGLLITILMGGLTFLLWSFINKSQIEPPWPVTIQGFCFSPMRGAQSPKPGEFPSLEEIDQDLALLEGKAYAVRTYTVESTMAEVPRLALAHRLNVTLGAWISRDKSANEEQIDKLIDVFQHNDAAVIRLIVGNEVLLRGDQTVEQMIDYLDRVREEVWAPVSMAEPWHIWLKYPELVEHVDFIAVHILPYWEGLDVEKAVDYVFMRYQQLKDAYPDKEVVIAEVGWPSNGRTRGAASATQANQARFLRRFLARAEREGYTYYVMEAFDQLWKRESEGEAGTNWGVYDVDRQPKFEFTAPVVRIPGWRGLVAISIGLTVLLLALMFRDSDRLKKRGRGFLALVAYSITTLAVWMVYEYSRLYLTPFTLAMGIMLFIAALGVIIVLLAEAHEFAEAVWMAPFRHLSPPAVIPDEQLPMVSVHVAAYNEPPDMMIQTLNALASLRYPRYEVLVIDNNTKDPSVWEPVRDHCEKLGPKFRFFHVDPLSGFKAGALNFALRQTDPDAEIVAVIDSDYLVSADWLRDMVPYFGDPEMAVVQGPQDYRDGAGNAFKAMCMAEYRGFFHIGMVTRDQRNAIIQHGTMTLVRRRVLEEVGGWGEWCITEDAELGLRIFERGYKAIYIPRSYGKGLMPDNFTDFKKQRFRWAYGAVLILRRHLTRLVGMESSKLTWGQRYHFIAGWLPWLADGFSLAFNLAALAWSVSMLIWPEIVSPPNILFAILPLSLFAFKLFKMLFLYRRRVRATLRQSLAAGVAGLALSHTIARAVFTGFVTRQVGFFRTPKHASSNALIRSLMDAREELLMLVALSLAIVGMYVVREDSGMIDVRIWIGVLVVQGVPYLAAVLLASIGSLPGLPARLIGAMN
jgi:exo-beta-1,3-glucanase (GH17 family)/cellulose synthase/poly-beta-1,6-N-acetylglucosamine synthase-like glycosyltransferase